MGLSKRSRRILSLIAAGKSYEQILARSPRLSYLDIFAAAREALEVGRAKVIANRPRRAVAAPAETDDDDLRPLLCQQCGVLVPGARRVAGRAVLCVDCHGAESSASTSR